MLNLRKHLEKSRHHYLLRALAASTLACLLAACAAHSAGLLRPTGVAVAPDGTLYVMDRGNYRVVHLSATGEFLGAFGKLGTGSGDIYKGWDAATDAAGNVYVCNMVYDDNGEMMHDGVTVFAPDGHFLREMGAQDYVYDISTPSNSPYGVAVDAEGRVYIADLGTDTVRVFDAQGRPLATLFGEVGSGEGEFNDLGDVAVDDRRGLLYAVDQINSRVKQYDLAFTTAGAPAIALRLTFGDYGRGAGQFSYPQSIAVDQESGTVYVADMGNLRIQAFDPAGNYLTEFAPPETETWQVIGIAVGLDGTIYAADAFNNVVWVFGPDGQVQHRIEVGR